MIDRLIELEKAIAADPGDIDSRVLLVNARARVQGPDVYLEPLHSLEQWDQTLDPIQDMAIAEVDRLLGGAFKLRSVQSWSCSSPCQYLIHSMPVDRRIGQACLNPHCEHGRHVTRHRLPTFVHQGTGIEFNLIPGYLTEDLLCPSCYTEGREPECPICGFEPRVNQSIRPFLMGRWPVTERQWIDMLGGDQKAASMLGINSDNPLTGEDYSSLVRFTEKQGLRLPALYEWRYACRAGTDTRFYWGEDLDDSHVWHERNSSTCPVCGEPCLREYQLKNQCCKDLNGTPALACRPHSPRKHDEAGKWNPFGLVDMFGNVWEALQGHRAVGFSFSGYPHGIDSQSATDVTISYANGHAFGFRAAASIPGWESS